MFAVFDGHAGKEVARVTSSEFTDHLLTLSPFDSMSDKDDYNQADVIQGLHHAFQVISNSIYVHQSVLLELGQKAKNPSTIDSTR